MKLTRFAIALAVCVAVAPASTITTVSDVPGALSNVTVDSTQANGANMAGMTITAVFSHSGTENCTWLSNGTCTGTDFRVSFPTGTDTLPGDTAWTVTNLSSSSSNVLETLTIDALAGDVDFDACETAGTPHSVTSACTGATPGTNDAYTIGTAPGGSFGITASVEYTNELKLASQGSPLGDMWGEAVFTFGGNAFQGTTDRKETFTFYSDTDLLDSVKSTTPEPATFGLVGVALIGAGIFRRKIGAR